ncbi:MAG: amidohydrolase [Bdellovibrionaceae bacterium]|nr:amidohydrolase [Pseudobdellovibrionaceae bacterium]
MSSVVHSVVHSKEKDFSLVKYLVCSRFLSMKQGKAFIERDKVIEVAQEKIKAIYSLKEFETIKSKKDFLEKSVIYLNHHVVMPGLINTHTHLAMSLFRGLANDLSFQDWLFKNILPLEEKMVDPPFVNLGVELALLELIQNGTTTACDMYFHQSEAAKVFDKMGLRAFLGEAINDGREGWVERVESLQNIYKNNNRITVCLAPHAPYTCGDDLLEEVSGYSKLHNTPVFIHVSETEQEVAESKKKYGQTPVERLDHLGLTGKNAVFVHCVHLSEKDIQILKNTKTAVSHNPESNMKLGSGRAPLAQLLEANIAVGLGTDGAASNNNLNLWGEVDTAAKLHKLQDVENLSVSSEALLNMMTYGAAQAIGQENNLGSLEPGKFADIIALDINYPHLRPLEDLISHLVYSASGLEVDFVMCGAKVIKFKNNILNVNVSQILDQAEQMRLKIKQAHNSIN